MSLNTVSSRVRRDNLADRIFVDGQLMDNPCSRCVENNLLCIRSYTLHCAECTRVPVKCTPAFVDDKDWKALLEAEARIDNEIQGTRNTVTDGLVRLNRLRKQRRLLKERARRFMVRDSSVLDYLEFQNSASSFVDNSEAALDFLDLPSSPSGFDLSSDDIVESLLGTASGV
jgi:hypothetical protein